MINLESRIAMSWCHQNGIVIVPVPLGPGIREVRLEVHVDHKITKGTIVYKQNEDLAKKIYELYRLYFKNRN